MFKQHPVFIEPNDDDYIWRYMDLSKFINIIELGALYFTRADKFEDKFEGSFGNYNISMRDIVYEGKIPKEQIGIMSNFSKEIRKYILINCWHINNHESAAMWKLYSRSMDSIAIRSTFKRLKDSFKETQEDIYIGKVNYIDYDNEWIPESNLLQPYIYKRKSFEHEKELRAVIHKIPVKDGKTDLASELFDYGLSVKVDLKTLIECIYVSPYTPKWFHDLMQLVAKRYQIDSLVIRSIMDAEPHF